MKIAFHNRFLVVLFILLSVVGAMLLTGTTLATHPFKLLFAILFFIGAAAIAGRPVVYILTRRTGTLFFPGNGSRKPPPAYSIAEAYLMKGDFAQALHRYEEIVATHPQELRAYVAMVEIALANVHDSVLAKRILDRGLIAISSEHGKQHLQDVYDESWALWEKNNRPSVTR